RRGAARVCRDRARGAAGAGRGGAAPGAGGDDRVRRVARGRPAGAPVHIARPRRRRHGDDGNARAAARGRRRRARGGRPRAAARSARSGPVRDDRVDPVRPRARGRHGAGRPGRGIGRLPAPSADRRPGAGGRRGGRGHAAEVDVLLPQALLRLPVQSAGRVMRQEWLDFCRRVAADVEVALADLPTRDDREPVGSGGDDTTVMDDRAEQAAVAQLEALHARGIDFRLVSEELGERTFGPGESPWVVIVDPIDGSLNAKRRLPFYCLSIAFADGPTIADVRFGYVRDFGSGEEWVAEAGGGATVDGRPLGGIRPKARFGIVDFEATNASLVAAAAARMDGNVGRIRVMGALALAL